MTHYRTQEKFRNVTDYENFYAKDNLYSGLVRTHNSILEQFDPYVTGYSFFVWLRLPKFFEESMSNRFKNMTENNFMSFSGINDFKLETDTTAHGFTGNELTNVTNMKKEHGTFNIKHKELAGSPIREMYQYWISGIRDPETGLATFHGSINEEHNYSAKNYTGELLYVVTDPSGGFQDSAGTTIEFACAFTRVYPTVIPRSHLNFAVGDHAANTECDIEFVGHYHESKDVNDLAIEALQEYCIKKRYEDYKVNVDGDVRKKEHESLY